MLEEYLAKLKNESKETPNLATVTTSEPLPPNQTESVSTSNTTIVPLVTTNIASSEATPTTEATTTAIASKQTESEHK